MDNTKQLQELEQQLQSHESASTVLIPALQAAVPLYILKFQQRGGITETDTARVYSYLEEILAHGDDLFYRSKKRGETAERFDQVAEIIAVFAFAPGGVTVFGLHFEAHQPPCGSEYTSNGEASRGEEDER